MSEGIRSEPTASSTARTSSIRCSSVGSCATGTGSDRPVPRLSKTISRAIEASRSTASGNETPSVFITKSKIPCHRCVLSRASVTPWGAVEPWDGGERLDWYVAADDRWHVPADFHIARACSRRWATTQPGAVAIHWQHENGAEASFTYGQLQRAANRPPIVGARFCSSASSNSAVPSA